MHEVLATAEEMAVAVDMGDYFRIPPDRRGLNYDAHSYLPQLRVETVPPYSSDRAQMLGVKEMQQLLLKAGGVLI